MRIPGKVAHEPPGADPESEKEHEEECPPQHEGPDSRVGCEHDEPLDVIAARFGSGPRGGGLGE